METRNLELIQRRKSHPPQASLTQDQPFRSLKGHCKSPSVRGKEACRAPCRKTKPIPSRPDKLDLVPRQGHQAGAEHRLRPPHPGLTLLSAGQSPHRGRNDPYRLSGSPRSHPILQNFVRRDAMRSGAARGPGCAGKRADIRFQQPLPQAGPGCIFNSPKRGNKLRSVRWKLF